ncbi:glycerophosphodiester phosphodiesterase family protein [Mucilaginibacter sp. HD30]
MIATWLTSKPIAHRGLHTNNKIIPENSISAFRAAIKRGFPIELDVHVTVDGTVIVFHDNDLERMCGVKRDTDSLRLEELTNLFLKNSKETVPTLKSVLDVVDGQVPILIEIKELKNIGQGAEKIWKVLRDYSHEYAIQAFNPFILAWFARRVPEITRGQLASGFKNEKMFFLKKFLLRNYLFNFISRPYFIGHNIHDLPSKRVNSFREKGIIALGWTVKSMEEMETAKQYCDNIIFEQFIPI